MNSPVFSPMMLFPLEADALPGSGECREYIQSKRAEQDNNKDLQFRFVQLTMTPMCTDVCGDYFKYTFIFKAFQFPEKLINKMYFKA